MHYGDFLKSEEKIATNILADRLNVLERTGIVKKIRDSKNKTRYIYSLTKKGINTMPMLVEIVLWSAKYDSKTATPKKFVARAKSNRRELIKQIGSALKRNKDFFQPK